MTALEDRRIIVRHIDEAHAAGARLAPACQVVGITARTLQRWRTEDGQVLPDGRPTSSRPRPAHALTGEEKALMLASANEPRFASLPPARIVPMLADEGTYMASESSFQRVLRAAGQNPQGPGSFSCQTSSSHHTRGHRTRPGLMLGHDVSAQQGPGPVVLSVLDHGPVQPQDRGLENPRTGQCRPRGTAA